MKITSSIATPYYFAPVTITQSRPVRRQVATRIKRPTSIETSDELARKQEVVCGAILGLSLVSSLVLSFWQLALP